MTKEEALKLYEAEMAKVKELEAQIRQLTDKKWTTKEAARKIFIENQLYAPIAELEALSNRNLYDVTIYYIAEDHEDLLSEWLNGDILRVENGRLYFSDYNDGIIEWHEEEQSYYWLKWGNYTKIQILGYSDLKESRWQYKE